MLFDYHQLQQLNAHDTLRAKALFAARQASLWGGFNKLRLQKVINVELCREALYYRLLYQKLELCQHEQAVIHIHSLGCCTECERYDGFFHFTEIIDMLHVPTINCPTPWKVMCSVWPLKVFLVRRPMTILR